MKTENETIRSADLCALLDVSRTTLSDYVERDVIKPLRHGVFAYPNAVTAVVRHLRNASASRATTAGAETDKRRFVKAKADQAEMQVDKLRGELWRKEVVMHVFGDQLTNCRARLLAIPTRAAPQLVGCNSVAEIAEKIQTEVHAALQELSECRGVEEVARRTDADNLNA